jgi:hypothetical protein
VDSRCLAGQVPDTKSIEWSSSPYLSSTRSKIHRTRKRVYFHAEANGMLTFDVMRRNVVMATGYDIKLADVKRLRTCSVFLIQ